MDADRFDALVHTITAAVPRRAALVAGMAALMARFETEDIAARNKKKRKNRKNRKKRQKCCPAFTVRCRGTCCQPGQRCEDPGSGCVNGKFVINERCDPDLAGQCATGNCGCDGDDCFCRNDQCSVGNCLLDSQCCQGRCVNNTICAGG